MKTIYIRTDDETKSKIVKLSKENGMTENKYMNKLLKEWLKKEKVD